MTYTTFSTHTNSGMEPAMLLKMHHRALLPLLDSCRDHFLELWELINPDVVSMIGFGREMRGNLRQS
jgi:hypothetical protein